MFTGWGKHCVTHTERTLGYNSLLRFQRFGNSNVVFRYDTEEVLLSLSESASHDRCLRGIHCIHFAPHGATLLSPLHCVRFDFASSVVFGWGPREGDSVAIYVADLDGAFWLVRHICCKKKVHMQYKVDFLIKEFEFLNIFVQLKNTQSSCPKTQSLPMTSTSNVALILPASFSAVMK